MNTPNETYNHLAKLKAIYRAHIKDKEPNFKEEREILSELNNLIGLTIKAKRNKEYHNKRVSTITELINNIVK